jgi:hypothetical protein
VHHEPCVLLYSMPHSGSYSAASSVFFPLVLARQAEGVAQLTPLCMLVLLLLCEGVGKVGR